MRVRVGEPPPSRLVGTPPPHAGEEGTPSVTLRVPPPPSATGEGEKGTRSVLRTRHLPRLNTNSDGGGNL